MMLAGAADESDITVELLHDIRIIFDTVAATFIASKDLAEKLAALDSRPWSEWKNGKPITPRALADRLKAFGIRPMPNERGTARGYYRDRFEDDWARYPGSKPSNRQESNQRGPELAISNRQTPAASDTSKLANAPTKTHLFDGLTQGELDQEGTPNAGDF